MKRKDFFKTILGITAAAVVTPSVFKEEPKFTEQDYGYIVTEPGQGYIVDVNKIPPNGYSIEEVIKIWKETGILLYCSVQ